MRPPGLTRRTLLVGKPAPEFAGTAADGSRFAVADLRGKPALLVLLNNHGSEEALEALPQTEALKQEWTPRGLQVVCVLKNCLPANIAAEAGMGRHHISHRRPGTQVPGEPMDRLPAAVVPDVRPGCHGAPGREGRRALLSAPIVPAGTGRGSVRAHQVGVEEPATASVKAVAGSRT